MKKALSLIVIAILILLSMAALEDITTGNEPSYIGEYGIIVTTIIVSGIFGFMFFKEKR